MHQILSAFCIQAAWNLAPSHEIFLRQTSPRGIISGAMHQLFLQTVRAIYVQICLLQHTLPLGHRHRLVHLLLRQGLGFCKYTTVSKSELKRKLHCKKRLAILTSPAGMSHCKFGLVVLILKYESPVLLKFHNSGWKYVVLFADSWKLHLVRLC
jgi:hypothetical protein